MIMDYYLERVFKNFKSLMKDDEMYNNFTSASKELELLLQDLRLHPTRYVNVSVFGKKDKPYKAPEVNDKNEQINK